MAGVAGIELKYALKKATTWGTAVACGAGDGFLSLPAGINRTADNQVDDSLGLFWSQDGTPGAVVVGGDLPQYLRYDGCDLLLALFCGIAGAPTQVGTSLAYDYLYELADNTDGLFATFARWYKNYVSEVPSLKVSGITIRGEQGQPLQLVAQCIGDNVVQDGTNTLTTFESVTIAETRHRIQFAQGVFRMNDQVGLALSASDKIGPSSFELTATRNLTGTYGTYTTGGANSQDLIDEPVNDGTPEVNLRLSFPKHLGKTRLEELGSDTRKKMDITFTGAEIAAGVPRVFGLRFPHLQLRTVDITDEQGIISEPVEMTVHGTPEAPAGMTCTAPFEIFGTNQRDTDPLA
jgi:hypothetical protein